MITPKFAELAPATHSVMNQPFFVHWFPAIAGVVLIYLVFTVRACLSSVSKSSQELDSLTKEMDELMERMQKIEDKQQN